MIHLSRIAACAYFIVSAVASAGFIVGCSQTGGTTELIAIGSLMGSSAAAIADLSGLNGQRENGVPAKLRGGPASGPAYAAGTAIDNTRSCIARFQTISMNLTASTSANKPTTIQRA